MQRSIISYLSILLLVQSFLASVVAVPWYTDVAFGDSDLVIHDELKDPASGSVDTAMLEMSISNTVVVQSVTVTVDQTVTSFLQSASSMGPTSSEPTTIMSPSHDSPTSTSSSPSETGSVVVVTTFATVTIPASSSETSTFDTAKCDFKYCNAEGSSVCIFWEGYTSWDVSLGPIPGEQPTIIGAC